MIRIWKVLLLSSLWLSSTSLWAQSPEADSCECPELSCDSECEIEQKVDFYTENCPSGKVRSCARPTCVKMDPYPQICVQKMAKHSARQNAVGVVEDLAGQAWKLLAEDKKEPLDLGSLVVEKDVIHVGKASRVQITFDDGNKITLSENSQVELTEVLVAKKEKAKRTLLKLLRGKIRSQVKKPASQAASTQGIRFRVRTPTAVAGVRGTDFVVIYDENSQGQKTATQVSTFNGLVELSGHERPEKVMVAANETAAFISEGSKAQLTSVRKMTEDENIHLQGELPFRAPSDTRVAIAPATCAAPASASNECSLVCLNNPKGEKTCRADLPGVECMRRICRGNGKWENLHRLPANYSSYCDPVKPVSAPCDH